MKYTKVKLTKDKPKFIEKYSTSSISDAETLMKLKSNGYHITVIKSVEYSVSQYFKRQNKTVTIHSIEIDGDDVNVTVYKNDDHHNIVIPKADLFTGKFNYEFEIGCDEVTKVVDKDFKSNIVRHKTKKEILYLKC